MFKALRLFLVLCVLSTVFMVGAKAAAALTLGDQTIEAGNQFLGGSLGGCKFQFTGPTGQYSGTINVYIGFAYADLATNYKGVFGIYDVVAGKRVAVSTQTAGLAAGWNAIALIGNFQLVNGAWYWLVMHTPSLFAVAIRTSAYGVGVAGQYMWISTTTKTYDGTLPATLPTFAGTNARIASIYASLVTSGTSPPPTSPPTSPPPSTSQTSAGTATDPPGNLGIIPTNYYLTYGQGPQIIHLDTTVTRTGHASIRLDQHTASDVNYCREVDGTSYRVRPGDRIVVKVWVRTSQSSTGAASSYGGRVGIDLYAHTSVGLGIPSKSSSLSDMAGFPGWYGNPAGSINGWVVPWNRDWTQIGWDVHVPAQYYSYVDIGGRVQQCFPVQIDSFIVWLDARPVADAGHVWFADGEIYINP